MGLKAENISREFLRQGRDSNVFTALYPTDFTLESGKVTVVMGRSGSGKTTLLNICAGLLQPTCGKVWIGDTDIYALDDAALSKFRNEHISVIVQSHSAIASLTVLENVELPLNLYHQNNPEKALELLEMMGIAELKDCMPNQLSGGELRRMAIARSLMTDPDILLADEPTGDLDDENTEIVFRLLKDVAQKGTAVLLVTHENTAVQYADVLYKMDAGKLTKITG
ncbi:MAG: ABC transporter ATP-binding protein [Faecalicoccus sp.]|nr:ABC transporter ATP-binding protein [Faecalicoccus sp.]